MRHLRWVGLLVVAVSAVLVWNPSRADGPAMWRLGTLNSTVYFLGSFHILPADVDWRDARVDEAVEEAGTLVFEIDDSEMTDLEAAAMMQQRALLPGGKRLADVIASETYAQLEIVAPKIPIPMAMLDRLKPWYAGLMLTAGYIVSQGFSPDLGVDAVMRSAASNGGKKIRAFETLEQQLDALESLSTGDPDIMLLDTMRYLDEDSGLLDHVVTAWHTGDTEVLTEILIEDIAEYGDAYTALITDRNEAWVDQITDMLDEGGTYLIVVGAAHLVGPDSVIAMLEAKGFRAERF